MLSDTFTFDIPLQNLIESFAILKLALILALNTSTSIYCKLFFISTVVMCQFLSTDTTIHWLSCAVIHLVRAESGLITTNFHILILYLLYKERLKHLQYNVDSFPYLLTLQPVQLLQNLTALSRN